MRTSILTLVLSFFSILSFGQERDFVSLSYDFVEYLRKHKDTESIETQWKEVDIRALDRDLHNDTRRKAFWINIYNGYILKHLRNNPSYYDERSAFFKRKLIPIIGRTLSFAQVEHGIIRRSQFEYGLGYIRHPFPPKYERILRVKEKDARIHFALNCGAADCPPVVAYQEATYEKLVDANTQNYLQRISRLEGSDLHTTSLCSWFRGDFGGKAGIIAFHKRHGAIDSNDAVDRIVFKEYDWSLDLDNFVKNE